jgi:hypothetical protein
MIFASLKASHALASATMVRDRKEEGEYERKEENVTFGEFDEFDGMNAFSCGRPHLRFERVTVCCDAVCPSQ